MATKFSDALRLIERQLGHLQAGLSDADLAMGWTDVARNNYLGVYTKLRQDLIEGEDGELTKGGIARSMDYWGIEGGDLIEAAAQIDNLLRGDGSR